MQAPENKHIDPIPEAISRLQLCRALRDCGPLGVKNGFKHSFAESVYVYDDMELGYSDWNDTLPTEGTKCFKAYNPGRNCLVLLPLDNRIITGDAVKRGGIADGAILTTTDLAIIEFKTNTTNTLSVEIYDQKAVAQLWHTYNDIISARCSQIGITVGDMVNVEFFVVYDENLDVTSASASRQELMLNFYEQYQLPLFFDNEKTFS